MVTIVSHISDYFEQFNSSLTGTFKDSSQPNDVSPLFYIFDFERYSDQMATLRDLRTYMIQRWHNSFFYAIAYLFLIYSKWKTMFLVARKVHLMQFIFSWSDLYEEQTTLRITFMVSSMECSISRFLHLRSYASSTRIDLCHLQTWHQVLDL